jgi:hypothetical protein
MAHPNPDLLTFSASAIEKRSRLAGIVVNLLTYSGYYDIALRDFGLMLAALTLARLGSKLMAPGLGFSHRDWKHV